MADKCLFNTKTQMEPEVKKITFSDFSHDEIRDMIQWKDLTSAQKVTKNSD